MKSSGAGTDDRIAKKRTLVRHPGPHLPEGWVAHPSPTPVDVDLAGRQWHGYVDTLRAEGWEIIEVPPGDDRPDAVFVEDTVVPHGDLAVISRPRVDERKPEVAGTEATLASLGYRIARIEPPGTLDGGDVLKAAGVVWVGPDGRTNASRVEQFAELLGPLSARVVGVPVSPVLHLKSIVTALPDGTIVGFAPLVDDPGLWPLFLSVPEEIGAHVRRAPCGHGGHFRIREAGRRRHPPVRSTAWLTPSQPRDRRRSCVRLRNQQAARGSQVPSDCIRHRRASTRAIPFTSSVSAACAGSALPLAVRRSHGGFRSGEAKPARLLS